MHSLKNKSVCITDIAALMIAVLFLYAAYSKLSDYEQSKTAMLKQVFPRSISLMLTWAIPATELTLAGLLCIPQTRLKGLYASLFLLIIFTIYIAITMNGAFGKIPCSCGGILQKMNYKTHILFNISFIILAITGITKTENHTAYNS